MSLTLYCLNGPNLNLLGQREPHIYGTATLADVEALCAETCAGLGASLVFRQTNREGELIDWLQEARREADAVVLNAAAYTHTSIDVAPAASGAVAGFGPFGYRLALQAAAHLARERAGERRHRTDG